MMDTLRNKEQGTRYKGDNKNKNSKNKSPFSVHNTLFTNFGFTTIELLIVVAVVGILSTLFITAYPATQRRARDAERMSDIKQYQTAMEAYANRNNGNYPTASDIGTLCTNLSISPCINDSQGSYDVESVATEYVIWATLEQPSNHPNSAYFVACSSGRSGENTVAPSGSTCPALNWL